MCAGIVDVRRLDSEQARLCLHSCDALSNMTMQAREVKAYTSSVASTGISPDTVPSVAAACRPVYSTQVLQRHHISLSFADLS